MYRTGSRFRRSARLILACSAFFVVMINTMDLINQQNIPYEENPALVSGMDLFVSTMRNHTTDESNNSININTDGIKHSVQKLDEPVCNDTTCLRNYVRNLNRKQTINNMDRFELVSGTAVVIVIQVHERVDYLRHLLNSLRNVTGISQALLIFSHDFYSTEMNQLVASFDLCLTMQIFYPYSTQIYPTQFPGTEPNDCPPKNTTKEKAQGLNCTSADYPDRYGHYREAGFTQIKHHWLWKMSHIFEYLNVLRFFNDPILFLEEDQYATPDILVVLKQMIHRRTKFCADCSIITVGTHDKRPAYGDKASQTEIVNWISSKHNIGMAMDRSMWLTIKKCSEKFCHYDDYNWDWSLQALGTICLSSKLKVLVVRSPRVFHIGQCGVHNKKSDCDSSVMVSKIDDLVRSVNSSLFPESLTVAGFLPKAVTPQKPNGGWADPRDHKLCDSFVTDPNTHL